ncbi:MAG: DUF924 family protein [Deltaproteobacteria bacterium]|nr:DUF924 family protein [Deltaproteobacteria bacterium]
MTSTVDKMSEEIIAFWFSDACRSPEALKARAACWFTRDDAFDREIADRFGALPERAAGGELDAWSDAPRSALALILVMDQFPRNLFRESGSAFSYDENALRVALEAVHKGFDQALHPVEAYFLYLPFEHAEDLALQERSVALMEAQVARAPAGMAPSFESFADYARRHREIIERFGRFPHRNAVLGRPSTPDEDAYLRTGGETFGGAARKEESP